MANAQDIIEGVSDLANIIKDSNFIPDAAIIVSCAGRKWLLGNEIEHEVFNLFDVLERTFPLIGSPSLSEISPISNTDGDYFTCFHNVTYVILMLKGSA